jgi:crotonobetainyl-CoA:carnitine CoA-transferase CaiB-like acyl-CoA transferase
MNDKKMTGPLTGLRVLDVSIMAAGPWTAALLGMLGAEVIKVEPPTGDGTRWAQPMQRGMGTNFISMNVNKKDIILDLKTDEAREQAKALAKDCDIFVQNFRVGAMERLGLDFETLHAINPRLIYCSISGFGPTGPLATAGCGDPIMQAFSGFADINGAPDDRPESFRFTGFLDLSTGAIAVQDILAALIRRQETGLGQEIKLSMLEAALEMQFTRVSEILGAGATMSRLGSANPAFAPDRAYQAEDRYIFVSVTRRAQWKALCDALKMPELFDDPRFVDNRARCANRIALDAKLQSIFEHKPAVWWLRLFRRSGVPCVIAHDYEAFRYHQQIIANDMITQLDTDQWGSVSVGGLPWHFDETPCEIRPPSVPGADTESILGNLQMNESSQKSEIA